MPEEVSKSVGEEEELTKDKEFEEYEEKRK